MSNDPSFLTDGSVLSFDGVGNYIEVPDSPDFSLTTAGALTVSAWIRPATLTFPMVEKHKDYIHWLGKGEKGRQEWTFRMYNLDTTGNRPNRISFYVFSPGPGEGVGSYVQEPVTVGEWIHIVGAADDQNTYMYKNGVFKDCDAYTGPSAGPCGFDNRTVQPQRGTAPLRLGTRDCNSYFQGDIARVRIWNRLLTQDEIMALFQSDTAPQDGLVAEFLLSQDIAVDSAGRHNGVIVGATWHPQS